MQTYGIWFPFSLMPIAFAGMVLHFLEALFVSSQVKKNGSKQGFTKGKRPSKATFSTRSNQDGNCGLHQDSIENNDRVDGSGADFGHL